MVKWQYSRIVIERKEEEAEVVYGEIHLLSGTVLENPDGMRNERCVQWQAHAHLLTPSGHEKLHSSQTLRAEPEYEESQGWFSKPKTVYPPGISAKQMEQQLDRLRAWMGEQGWELIEGDSWKRRIEDDLKLEE